MADYRSRYILPVHSGGPGTFPVDPGNCQQTFGVCASAGYDHRRCLLEAGAQPVFSGNYHCDYRLLLFDQMQLANYFEL